MKNEYILAVFITCRPLSGCVHLVPPNSWIISICRWYTNIDVSRPNHCNGAKRLCAATDQRWQTFIPACGTQWTDYAALHRPRPSCANLPMVQRRKWATNTASIKWKDINGISGIAENIKGMICIRAIRRLIREIDFKIIGFSFFKEELS